MYKFSKRSLSNRKGVIKQLIEIDDLALSICPIDFGHPGLAGKRTIAEQQKLFADGKSKCDGIKIKSYHQTGRALDFYAFVDGKASWDIAHLSIVATSQMIAAKQLGYIIEWGGFWKNFKDYPHIQYAGKIDEES